MRINPILLISILTFISIKTSHSREAEPKHHFNKESFSQYQARHCKWETGYTCKDVPKDQGMPPPRTSEEIALEVGLGLLAGGPTPQPKGFKFSIGKQPQKYRQHQNRAPSQSGHRCYQQPLNLKPKVQ